MAFVDANNTTPVSVPKIRSGLGSVDASLALPAVISGDALPQPTAEIDNASSQPPHSAVDSAVDLPLAIESTTLGAVTQSQQSVSSSRKRKQSDGNVKRKLKQHQESSTSTDGPNRLKLSVANSDFLWNGEDLKHKVIKCCELAEDAKVLWFCHVCVRGDEEYVETGDEAEHVRCNVCLRDWHSQCYETEYNHDYPFWEGDENDETPCLGCRTGRWKCALCQKFGYSLDIVGTGSEHHEQDILYKCEEVHCIARCHRHCIEEELLRSKTCFSVAKSTASSAQPSRVGRPKKTFATTSTDAKAGERLNDEALSNQCSRRLERPSHGCCDAVLPICDEDRRTSLPWSVCSSSSTIDCKVDTKAATINESGLDMTVQCAPLEQLSGHLSSACRRGNDAEHMPSSSIPSIPFSDVEQNGTWKTLAILTATAAVDTASCPVDPSVDNNMLAASSSLSPCDADSGVSSVAPFAFPPAADDPESTIQPATAAGSSLLSLAVNVRPKAVRERKPRVNSATINAPASVDSGNRIKAAFSYKCGRHECLVCKRLGRSVTVRTDDATASAASNTLCVGNVGKHGNFKRIALLSCLRCFRAVHFHPHCLPPTYTVNAYNSNFMLCEDHMVCEESGEFRALQEVRDATKAKNKKLRRRGVVAGVIKHRLKKKAVKKNPNEVKFNQKECALCGKSQDADIDRVLTSCEKCPASVHLDCLPSGQQAPADGKWLCSYHDPNEAMSPILHYDVVWCKDRHYPFWPARVVPWEDVPSNLRARYGKTAGGLYAVHYFQDKSTKAVEFAFLNTGRVLPFEEGNCTESFKATYRRSRSTTGSYSKNYGSLEAAIEYYRVLQRVRDSINAKTFQIFSASWEFTTIAWNQPVEGVKYARRSAAVVRRRKMLKPIAGGEDSAPEQLAASSSAIDTSTSAATTTENSDDSGNPGAPATTTTSKRRGSPRRPRAAAAACITKLVEFVDERGDDVVSSKCNCHVDDDGSGCDPSTCLNAYGKVECDDRNCRLATVAVKCRNRRLEQLHAPPGCTKRYNMTLRVDNRGSKGKGLVAKVLFARGDYIIEYVGEVVTPAERERREAELFDKYDQPMFYFMALDTKRVLDAQYKGNLSRFANHSCDPNANISRITWQGDFHIVLQARRDIGAGEEITYNYDWGTKGKNPMACQCGAKCCRGTIGLKVNIKNKRRKCEDNEIKTATSDGRKSKPGRKPVLRTGVENGGKKVAVKQRRPGGGRKRRALVAAVQSASDDATHATDQLLPPVDNDLHQQQLESLPTTSDSSITHGHGYLVYVLQPPPPEATGAESLQRPEESDAVTDAVPLPDVLIPGGDGDAADTETLAEEEEPRADAAVEAEYEAADHATQHSGGSSLNADATPNTLLHF